MCLRKKCDTLPKHGPYNCTIDLVERSQPPFGPIYNFSQDELARLHGYIDKNLKKGFIQHSKFPIGALILFVKKKYGFYECVLSNYRELNQLTMNNQYLSPLISRLLDQLNHAKVYTKIDLYGTYNLVHIQEGNEWKLMFRTHYDHFEHVVMPFGLTNMFIVFQHLMNDVFCECLDNFVVCYINDILFLKQHGRL
jgi:hypothetical protein